MNSNHRRELAQNDLANWFIAVYEDWIEPNAQFINTAVLVLLLLFIGIFAYNHIQKHNTSVAWQQYYTVLNLSDSEASQTALQTIADSGGSISTQARLTLSQLLLSDAVNGIAIDKVKAVAKLDKAAENFRKLMNNSDTATAVQAEWGLAQTLETAATVRDGNDLTEAKKEYETLSKKYPNEELGKQAARQLAFLDRPDTVKFIERSLAKSKEEPQKDDFKVNINRDDPFTNGAGSGFDAQKALENTKPEENKTEEKKPEEKKQDSQ